VREKNVYKKESKHKALHKHDTIKKNLVVVETEQTKLVCTSTLDKTDQNKLL